MISAHRVTQQMIFGFAESESPCPSRAYIPVGRDGSI